MNIFFLFFSVDNRLVDMATVHIVNCELLTWGCLALAVSNTSGIKTLRPTADEPSATMLALSQYCRPPPADPRWRNCTKGIANTQVGDIRCCVDVASYGDSLALSGAERASCYSVWQEDCSSYENMWLLQILDSMGNIFGNIDLKAYVIRYDRSHSNNNNNFIF